MRMQVLFYPAWDRASNFPEDGVAAQTLGGSQFPIFNQRQAQPAPRSAIMASTMGRSPRGGALLSWGFGVLGTGVLVYDGSRAFTDAPFVLSIIVHLLIGIGLTGAIFLAGSGVVLLTARETPALESLL